MSCNSTDTSSYFQRSTIELSKKKKKKNHVFFFETESAGDEAGVICVCFDIRNASSLDKE